MQELAGTTTIALEIESYRRINKARARMTIQSASLVERSRLAVKQTAAVTGTCSLALAEVHSQRG